MPVVQGKGTDDQDTLDLTKRPQPISQEGLTQFTVGDLHANTVKLIYTLIRNGVCTLPPVQYTKLVNLYQKDPMSDRDLSDFCELVDKLQIKNKTILVRLIGDMVADRGQNDLLTLKVLDKLRKENVPVRITMSNHDDQFMKFFNDSKTFAQLEDYTDLNHDSRQNQANSYTELVKYIKAGGTEEMKQQRFYEVKRMVRDSYLPNLVLLDYSRNKDSKSITLFSHAPIELKNIIEVAEEFGIPCDDIKDDGTPIETLIAVIDALNQDYQTNLQLGFHSDMMDKKAIKKIAWQRHEAGKSSGIYLPGLMDFDVDPRAGTPSITYVHGHDKPGGLTTTKNAICIDNNIGKGNLKNNGDNCVAYVSNEAISPGPVNQLPTATTNHSHATDNKLLVGYERVRLQNKMQRLEKFRGMGPLLQDGPEARYYAAVDRLEASILLIKEKQNTIPTTEVTTTDIVQKPDDFDQPVDPELEKQFDPFYKFDIGPGDPSPRSISELHAEDPRDSYFTDVQLVTTNSSLDVGNKVKNPSISLTNTTSVVQPAVTLTPNDHSVSSVNTLAASTAVKHSAQPQVSDFKEQLIGVVAGFITAKNLGNTLFVNEIDKLIREEQTKLDELNNTNLLGLSEEDLNNPQIELCKENVRLCNHVLEAENEHHLIGDMNSTVNAAVPEEYIEKVKRRAAVLFAPVLDTQEKQDAWLNQGEFQSIYTRVSHFYKNTLKCVG